jgi:cytochrome P450
LAKREVSVMIEQLLARFSDFRLAGEVEWLAAGPTTNVGVGVKRIPLEFSPS